VLVVERGETVYREIVPGFQDGKRLAVRQGLKEGDLVVINPFGLEAGEKVRPRVTASGAGSK
jgi:hypothetical protein